MVFLNHIPLNWKVLINEEEQHRFQTGINDKSYDNHPIVIFYDEYLKKVYYLSMKSYLNHHDVLINQKLYLKLDVDPNFKFNDKPSVIDTTTIYKMDYNEFVNTFKVDVKNLKKPNNYRVLDLKTQHDILEMIINNVDKNRICLKEISNNQSIVKYVNKKWIKKELYNQLVSYPNKKKKLPQILKDVDDNHLIVSIHKYIDKNLMTLQNTNGVRNIICSCVNQWNITNQLDETDPLFIDIDQIHFKWKKQKQDLNKEN